MPHDQPLYQRLKSDLPAAMKARDARAIAAIRTVLSAIDNAGAVPVEDTGPVLAFVGRTNDVPRRDLSEREIRAIIEREAEEKRRAVATYEALGKEELVEQLRAELDVLARYL